MTLKDGYGFGGFSGTPPSEPNLSTPPPLGGYSCQQINTYHNYSACQVRINVLINFLYVWFLQTNDFFKKQFEKWALDWSQVCLISDGTSSNEVLVKANITLVWKWITTKYYVIDNYLKWLQSTLINIISTSNCFTGQNRSCGLYPACSEKGQYWWWYISHRRVNTIRFVIVYGK